MDGSVTAYDLDASPLVVRERTLIRGDGRDPTHPVYNIEIDVYLRQQSPRLEFTTVLSFIQTIGEIFIITNTRERQVMVVSVSFASSCTSHLAS